MCSKRRDKDKLLNDLQILFSVLIVNIKLPYFPLKQLQLLEINSSETFHYDSFLARPKISNINVISIWCISGWRFLHSFEAG